MHLYLQKRASSLVPWTNCIVSLNDRSETAWVVFVLYLYQYACFDVLPAHDEFQLLWRETHMLFCICVVTFWMVFNSCYSVCIYSTIIGSASYTTIVHTSFCVEVFVGSSLGKGLLKKDFNSREQRRICSYASSICRGCIRWRICSYASWSCRGCIQLHKGKIVIWFPPMAHVWLTSCFKEKQAC